MKLVGFLKFEFWNAKKWHYGEVNWGSPMQNGIQKCSKVDFVKHNL